MGAKRRRGWDMRGWCPKTVAAVLGFDGRRSARTGKANFLVLRSCMYRVHMSWEN
jgi:hypothetical protein